jgi:oligoendopeptidase F
MSLQNYITGLQKPSEAPRFLPQNISLDVVDVLKPYFDDLLSRTVSSPEALWTWLKDRSELGAFLEENLAWRYIRMTCQTDNESAAKAYAFFIGEVEPKISLWQNELDKKLASFPDFENMDFNGAEILRKNVRKDLEIFREENIPLQTKIQTLAQEYSTLSGAMAITHDGKELTLPQAGVLLQSTDRALRKTIYESIQERRFQDSQAMQTLFSSLIQLRHQVALNAGFANFRDYMFLAMGRFDYQPADCKSFHKAVEAAVVPLVAGQLENRRKNLGIQELKPYDLAVEENGLPPLKAFDGGKDLLEKGKKVFARLDPFLRLCLDKMDEMGHFDLESRKGKAPGGYNYPLDQTGFPFIFMNASSTLRDMVTLMHEGGHAVHSIVTRFLPLDFFKHTPSEVAELASMSMELMSMDHWDIYFPEHEDCLRAKREHLQQVIDTLPWVATIDAFQHWLYENPNHSEEERLQAWLEVSGRFSGKVVDYTGYEHFRTMAWQKQLHLFEVPFYYIEYGMAQLGAIAVWRNYRQDSGKALLQYMEALSLGHTVGIREVYSAAGIRFDFSENYIRELMDFVRGELDKLS